MRRNLLLCALLVILRFPDASAQVLTHRGFVDARATVFPQETALDRANTVVDVQAREEVFVKPAAWIQFAAGLDVRGNTHDQVKRNGRPDFSDRATRRPLWSIRRLSATVHYRRVTVDAGKQFIRWGKADIVTPTDYFAPRDFLNVIDSEFLGVTGARGAIQLGNQAVDLVVLPRLTPSRVPLLTQRWAPVPAQARDHRLVDGGARFPDGMQTGVRWLYTSAPFEVSLSYFNGFNHLPNIEVHVPFVPGEIILTRVYPEVAAYGADAAVPTRWFTIKGESAYFTSPAPRTDEYVLYVLQLERLVGEWVLVGGYAGEVVTARNAQATFAPNRGLTRSILGRASYTIDVNRTAAIEGVIRRNGDGGYVRVEYSQARGQHWRFTLAGAVIAGDEDDFLGQYRLNSHLSAAMRYSF
jgi:hypothetical protein